MKLFIIIFFVLSWNIFYLCTYVNAQSQENPGLSVVSDLLEEMAASELENADFEEIADDLYSLIEQPLDLNKAGEEELKKLHILNDFQIFTFLEYVRDQGPILSINELQTIIGFSDDVILKMRPFVFVSPVQIPEVDTPIRKPHPQQQILFRYGREMNLKKGFQTDTIARFLGKNRTLMSRYEFKSGENLMAGFTMEQDAGESFRQFSKSFRPDFISAFCEIHKKGWIKQINIGDFRASYGQGLVLSGYPLRKGSGVLIKPSRSGIRKYSSTGENDLFRGAAIRMGRNKFSMDLFYSRFERDATIYIDSSRYFRSLSSAGLHRTYAELEKKDALLQSGFGAHALYKNRILDLGFTWFGQNFDADYLVQTDPFNFQRFQQGNVIWNISSDFKLNLKKTVLFGELATDPKGKTALLTGILAELHPLIRYSFIYRNYNPFYFGPGSGGFGEKSNTRNEEGFYMGIEMYPFKYLKIDLFSDHYSFPFPDLSSTVPSSGNEYFLNFSFNKANIPDFSFKTRYEKKHIKSDRPEPGIDLMDETRKVSNRFEIKCAIFPGIEFKSRTELSYYKKSNAGWTKGYYCGNDLSMKPSLSNWKFWIRYAVFDIQGWDNRIYAYENDVLYGFTVPAYNSKGTRTVMLLKVPVIKKMEVWLRYSSTAYLGIRTTGTGLDEVKSDRDRGFTLQVRAKF